MPYHDRFSLASDDESRARWVKIVKEWTEDHLQAALWKSSHSRTAGNDGAWIDLLSRELKSRGITPKTAYAKTACCVCGGKAIYRLRDLVFCSHYKAMAVAGREVYARDMDGKKKRKLT